MKTSNSTFGRVLCSLFGHNYVVSRKVTLHITEYQCTKCKCEMTTNELGRMDVLTPELKEINETLAKFYRRRQAILEHTLQSVA
ncbi:hypothetical protein OOZ15_14835 [Galbibacter sp. EGI 63066]|uniref:hypothetical protein n=1 Tax=Galbibacter sp. EGI 63066 TaxID=2993559 RepID=UPI0022493AB9|nr:hypothetical protein [Galbibacter sp. EGI 63066]MCX2681226.1 hypothetical protein [Galbibacter sp. EGI 63066]